MLHDDARDARPARVADDAVVVSDGAVGVLVALAGDGPRLDAAPEKPKLLELVQDLPADLLAHGVGLVVVLAVIGRPHLGAVGRRVAVPSADGVEVQAHHDVGIVPDGVDHAVGERLVLKALARHDHLNVAIGLELPAARLGYLPVELLLARTVNARRAGLGGLAALPLGVAGVKGHHHNVVRGALGALSGEGSRGGPGARGGAGCRLRRGHARGNAGNLLGLPCRGGRGHRSGNLIPLGKRLRAVLHGKGSDGRIAVREVNEHGGPVLKRERKGRDKMRARPLSGKREEQRTRRGARKLNGHGLAGLRTFDAEARGEHLGDGGHALEGRDHNVLLAAQREARAIKVEIADCLRGGQRWAGRLRGARRPRGGQGKSGCNGKGEQGVSSGYVCGAGHKTPVKDAVTRRLILLSRPPPSS